MWGNNCKDVNEGGGRDDDNRIRAKEGGRIGKLQWKMREKEEVN